MTTTRTSLTVSTAVADVAAERSGAVFGLMGNGNAYVVGRLTAAGAPYVRMRHEVGTVAAAQAYFLASGTIATATTTYGAGFTNALTALAEARLARVPLVLVAGEGPSVGPRWWDVDQDALAAGLDVPVVRVPVDGAAAAAHYAYDLAEWDRTPVVLSIPYDLATESAAASREIPRIARPAPARPTDEQVAAVAATLRGAERPLLLLGRGAHLAGAGELLREVGDRLGALFATSVTAAGLPGSPWDLGVAGGFSTPRGWELITAADVVLAVGISLNDFQDQRGRLLAHAREVVQVDLGPVATHGQVTRYVRADAAAFAAALLSALEDDDGAPGSSAGRTWRQLAPYAAGDLRADLSAVPEHAPDGRLDPRLVARRLDELLPPDRALVHDGGQFVGWMPQHARVTEPSQLILVGTALQTIGLGSASAVGAAHARPERTTVLVTGDGGGVMALADLVTFVNEAESGVVVVFNDAAYGAELHQYGAKGVDRAGMLLEELDFAALGQALGAGGRRVTRLAELDVVGEWGRDGARGVLVVDVAVSRTVVADFITGHPHPS